MPGGTDGVGVSVIVGVGEIRVGVGASVGMFMGASVGALVGDGIICAIVVETAVLIAIDGLDAVALGTGVFTATGAPKIPPKTRINPITSTAPVPNQTAGCKERQKF